MKTINSKFLYLLLFIALKGYTQNMVKVIPEDKSISPFLIDERETTMQDFYEFVMATSYETTCEKLGYGGIFNEKGENVKTKGINWRHDPYGNLIDKNRYENLPVARLSLDDVKAYAKWKGKRLPTTKEWMIAAQSGLSSPKYKYSGSNILSVVGWYSKHLKYVEQGFFDVKQKKPNKLGIYDMSGNAEEMTCLTNKCDTLIRKGGRYISESSMSSVDSDYSMKITNKNFNLPFIGFRLVKN